MDIQPQKTLDKVEEFLTNPPFKRKRPKWLKRIIIALVVLLIIFLVIVVPIVIQGTQIFRTILRAEDNVSSLAANLVSNDYLGAQNNLKDLKLNVLEVQYRINNMGPILAWPSIRISARASDQMLSSTASLLAGYDKILGLMNNINLDLEEQSLTLGFKTPEQKELVLRSLKENQELFDSIEKDIKRAEQELFSVNTNDLTSLLQDKLLVFSQTLEQAITNTEVALPIVSNLPDLAGFQDEKIYLFLFQNNMELRPTGGFIGSYGIVKVENGEITDLHTDDIYNLDKYSIGKINLDPPAPMVKYLNVDSWYLRDANWSPDWSTSVEQILWFFNEERQNAGLEPIALDGVIAITPEFIANLLEVTGPIMADGITFEADNFAQDLEQFVEFDYVKYGISRSNRKAIIGDLTGLLIERLHQLPPHEMIQVWLAFKKNIDEKNILVYLLDENLQDYFSQKNWSGEVKQTDGDYLLVVDSNMAALKTDSVMKKDIAYSLEVKEGELIANLELTYSHEGEFVSGFISRYQDYVRVYVPEGTWFLGASLESEGSIKELDINKDFEIGSDLNKKYGATFFTVDPGKSKILKIQYRLPDIIKQQYLNKAYNLLVQKQPGTIGHDLNISLDFNQPIKSYHAFELSKDFSTKHIGWDTDLSVDREYQVNF